jgi:hypothetical protein
MNKANNVLVQMMWMGDLNKKAISYNVGEAEKGVTSSSRKAQFATAVLPLSAREHALAALENDSYQQVAPGVWLPSKSLRMGSTVTLIEDDVALYLTVVVPA